MFGQQIVQGSFRGFSGLGDTSGASGQALRGSVIDAVVYVGDASRVFFYDSRLLQSLTDRLNSSGFKVINLDGSNLGSFGGGGTIRVRAQINSDGYSSANDAASVIAGAASALGFNATGSTGVVVSTPQSGQTGTGSGQTQSGQAFDPSTVPGNKPLGATNPFEDFIKNLTASPVTLAVILGAAVVLVIAAKK